MASVGIRELLEAGVHFGHQTRRWNPKMRRFIHGENGGIYLIDLLKTERLLDSAQQFASEIAHRGGTVLFVGTKKQARDAVRDVASEAGMPYVNHRWLGGLLTNFQTINQRIKRLHDLERYETEGQLALLPTRERLAAEADLVKLRANLGGVKDMQRPPDALFVVDLKTEAIAVREAQRLRIPIIGLVDTNCDPDGIDYVIPGNDDAIRSCLIITKAVGDVVSRGRHVFRQEEERARQEAEAQARFEAEERARKEAEEEARKAAETAAAEEALTQGGEGMPRDQAEQVVAAAVAQGGRRPVEGRRSAEAGAAAVAADEPAAPATGNVGPGTREERQNPGVGDRVPQEAGAAGAAGSPASDTAQQGGGEVSATSARQAANAPDPTPAPEPGPSPIAEAAAAEAPPVEPTSSASPAAEPITEVPDAATEEGGPSPVDAVQGAANAAVDTAQDAAVTVAETAANTADAVAERTPGPLKGLAKLAAGATGVAADVVTASPADKDKKDDPDTTTDEETT